jgi:hypothetical protein
VQKVRPYIQNNQTKRDRGEAQTAECLPRKYKALSSNLSTTTTTTKKAFPYIPSYPVSKFIFNLQNPARD